MSDDTLGGTPQRKKPGPKPKAKRMRDVAGDTDRDAAQSGLSLDSREDAAHTAPRPKRVSMHGSLKLSIPAHLLKKGYTPRWFKDKDSRVAQAQGAYWEHIKDDQGNNLVRPSGPYMMYAMQLENRYVEEDRALKRDKIAARIKKESKVAANEYSDHGGDSALSVETDNPHS